MGRKPKAARVEPTSNPTGTSDPSRKWMEIEQHMENPGSLPAKKKAANIINTGNSDPSPKRMENEQHVEKPGSLPAEKKGAKSMNVIVRRSGRLRNLSSRAPNKEIVVEEIDLIDGEGEDEPRVEELSIEPGEPHIEDVSTEPISSQQDLEEKIDFLVQSVKEFKSEAKRTLPSETQFTELNYKSLYIDSQKKIEFLVDENHQLAKKLEFALGKIEAYEQMKDVTGNMKDIMLVSNLGKATEAVINFSSQVGTVVGSPVAANDDPPKASPEKKKLGRKKRY